MDECKWCKAPAKWLKTKIGKNILVDAETYHGELMFEYSKHRAHWSTCPYAEEVRTLARKEARERVALTKSEKKMRGAKDDEGD